MELKYCHMLIKTFDMIIKTFVKLVWSIKSYFKFWTN